MTVFASDELTGSDSVILFYLTFFSSQFDHWSNIP